MRILAMYVFLSVSVVGASASAEELDALSIMQSVNSRNDGDMVQRRFELVLTNKNGRTKTETTRSYRRYFGSEKRTVIFYEEPTRVRGTGFLTFDYADPSIDDDQWLYLPALRKIRRISASDRGDFFLGTDFTYEDIKKEQKVEINDYVFTSKGDTQLDGRRALVVEGIPLNQQIADELGYSMVVWHVDPAIWMSRETHYYDANGNHAKTITIESIDVIDDIVTATKIIAVNHKTGHSTRLTFSDIDYQSNVPESIFSQARLRRGL